MIRKILFAAAVCLTVIAPGAFTQRPAPTPEALQAQQARNTPVNQVRNTSLVTPEMLLNPNPDDWLMGSRTYDWQRYSPLKQITKENVGQLSLKWVRPITETGGMEYIPIVHDGVMYIAQPNDVIDAVDATTGELIWENRRKLPDDWKKFTEHDIRVMALYQDMLFYGSADGFQVALDARSGALRWQTQDFDYHTHTRHSSGPIVVGGMVLSGRSCANDPIAAPEGSRDSCFINALDAESGKELWKFFTTAGPGEAGNDSWGTTPPHDRTASPWGLPGAYDPVRNLVYWGIGNPSPYPRLKRHYGNIDDIPRSSPADLYSDSTVALDVKTGKLAWYYQQIPGDDWDLDGVHERILIHTKLNPDPKSVKYVSSKIHPGEQRDIVVDVPEEGGVWVNDRGNGQFLWAEPFPYDTPNWGVSNIDVDTGKTYLNWDLVFKKEGERHIICYEDQKGWYPMSYSPVTNSLYIPYNDYCIDMQEQLDGRQGWSIRNPVPRPGSDPNLHGGVAKVSMETGKIERFYNSEVRTTSATLTTAGDLVFWGEANRRFRAFDSVSGKILWETILGGPIVSSTITYAVNGKQYIAVLTARPNTMYVFALPDKR